MYKNKLPKVFTAYRVVFMDNHSCFQNEGEPNCSKGTYIAGNYPNLRMGIPYPPGFHVLRRKPNLKPFLNLKVQKLKIKRSSVTQVGKSALYASFRTLTYRSNALPPDWRSRKYVCLVCEEVTVC
jgi:hypothetical protein